MADKIRKRTRNKTTETAVPLKYHLGYKTDGVQKKKKRKQCIHLSGKNEISKKYTTQKESNCTQSGPVQNDAERFMS